MSWTKYHVFVCLEMDAPTAKFIRDARVSGLMFHEIASKLVNERPKIATKLGVVNDPKRSMNYGAVLCAAAQAFLKEADFVEEEDGSVLVW